MKRLLFLGLLIPAVLFGQKNEIIALQRDVADLQEKMKMLQKSQDEKFAAVMSMLQQAIDGSGRAATGITSLQREVDTKLNDQQTKLVAPVATLGSKVDQLSDEFRAVSTTVADLRTKFNGLDGKLGDISSAIRTFVAAQTQATPPQPVVQTPPNPCTGFTAESLWESARRDKTGGKLEMAMTEYRDYVKCFAETANAPVAQFEVGWMYFKAVSLMKGDHRTEAGKVFKDYLASYPHGDHIANAHANLKTLGLEPRTPARKH